MERELGGIFTFYFVQFMLCVNLCAFFLTWSQFAGLNLPIFAIMLPFEF